MNNEEAVTTAFLAHETIDCLVNVVDATNLERNLMLTLRLRELNIPMILLLNFMDEAEKQHIVIDQQAISRRLGIPVYASSAFAKEEGELLGLILQTAGKPVLYHPLLDTQSDRYFVYLFALIKEHNPTMDDRQVCQAVYDCWRQKAQTMKMLMNQGIALASLNQMSEERHKKNLLAAVASCMRYVKQESENRYALTHAIDRIVLNRWLAYPLLLLFFILLLVIVFNGSRPYIDFIDQFFNVFLAKYIRLGLSFLPVSILDLITQGMLQGVGSVLSFLPLMALLFFCLGILEESGYMARVAFLLDQAMRHFHLSGKAFLTLLIGFGCNVPAIYATRALDSQKQKELTAMLIPFMSCSARLPVYMLFASAFFGQRALLAVLTVIGFGILLAMILALMIGSKQGRQEDASLFLMELPIYRRPKLSVLFAKVKREVKGFIHKAFTVVLMTMMILWGLSYFPNGEVKTSYIAQGAKASAFVFEPLGFGERWELVAALPAGISAKENVVGFLAQCLSSEQAVSSDADLLSDLKEQGILAMQAIKESVTSLFQFTLEENEDALTQRVALLFEGEHAGLKAFSFMTYICLSVPCVMAMAALAHEFGRRLLLRSLITMLIVPYVVCLLLYQGLSLFL